MLFRSLKFGLSRSGPDDDAASQKLDNRAMISTPPYGYQTIDCDRSRHGVGVAEQTRLAPRRPSMYKVLLLNDDYTPMDFVVYILQRFFAKSESEATQIMLSVHLNGVGACGVYTYEIAESKANQVIEIARQNQHPLQCTTEEA